MMQKADVLVENFRAGAMDRLGYDWDSLHKINSRLIYAAVSGFGHTGPYSDRPAYDLVVQGMGGIMSLTGTGDGEAIPVRVGTSVGDITAGMFGLSGVLAALYDREKTGQGIKVDVGMLDCQVAILENAVSRYFAENIIPGPIGIRHPSITPFAGLRAAGGEYLIVAAGNDVMFAHLCRILDRADLSKDARFLSNNDRTRNYQDLHDELEKTLAGKPAGEWLDILNQAGIPCGPINNIEQVVNDPQVKARNMIVSARSKTGVEFRMPGNPVKFSSYQDPSIRRAAPGHDENREAILAWLEKT
jgi:CoA:oxalate CoA-transferase